MASGCSGLFAPDVPEGAIPIETLPAEYEHWWSLVERCSQSTADLRDITWWSLPEASSFPGWDDVVGRYYEDGHQIVIREGYAGDGFTVRHEMLHAMLSRQGRGGHPREFFEARCGGVVVCSGSCRDEVLGVPLVANSASPVQVAAVDVSVAAYPMRFAECTTVVVSALNDSDVRVVMDLAQGYAGGFGWLVDGHGGGAGGGPTPPNRFVVLAPGEERLYAYDCPESIQALDAGDYRLRGEWQHVRSTPIVITVESTS